MTPNEVRDLQRYLTQDELEELNDLIAADLEQVLWRPLPGPQTMAYESTADVIGFGGAAGGGKTDLALGMALNEHHRAMFFRREGTQLVGAIDRLAEIIGSRDDIVGKPTVYRGAEMQIEFGSVPNPGDETKYQGRPRDLLVIDETANFLEAQVRFLRGWVRSTRPGQRKRTLMTFNPPTSAEGRWVVTYFGPWLDKRHPMYPTTPGKLRYVYTDPETRKDTWIDDDNASPFVLVDGQRVYDFEPMDYRPEQIVIPESRTFIPSRITDNPFLAGSGYMTVLQSLPEPLRSQMLLGDFEAGMEDDPWQVIPTAWVEAAMKRWKDISPRPPMVSMGVDVARGGKDKTVLVSRHEGNWYSKLRKVPGTETPDGESVVGHVIAMRRNSAPVHIDVIGVGASPYDLLRAGKIQVIGVNVGEKATGTDKSGRLRFMNQRSQLWWNLREQFDPQNDTGIAVPDDPELLADLTAPQWELAGMTVKVESRDDIVKRLGRSPDSASALILAQLDTPNLAHIQRAKNTDHRTNLDYDPLESF